jgi:hypothetical protein
MAQSIHEGESIDVLYRIMDDDEAEEGERRLARLVDGLLGGARRERELCLAGKGSVVAISTSANLLSRSLQLLDGRGSDIGFALTARREEGLARLGASLPRAAGGFEVHARPSRVLEGLQVLRAFESFVAAGGSDGGSLSLAYRADLPAAGGGEAGAVRKALEGAAITGMLRAVPKDSTWFRAGSGLLLATGIELAGRLVAALAPEDASDVVKSLIHEAFSRATGPHVLAGSKAEILFAAELDGEGARLIEERLRGAKKSGQDVVESGTALLLMPGPGSRALGALDGRILLGGTSGAVLKSVASLAGKEPSLADDAGRLKAVGVPTGDLLALGEGNADVVLALAAGASLLTPLLLRALPEEEEHALSRAVVGALPRLLPAAASLRFLDRFTAHSRKDGPATVRGEGRVTFAE